MTSFADIFIAQGLQRTIIEAAYLDLSTTNNAELLGNVQITVTWKERDVITQHSLKRILSIVRGLLDFIET